MIHPIMKNLLAPFAPPVVAKIGPIADCPIVESIENLGVLALDVADEMARATTDDARIAAFNKLAVAYTKIRRGIEGNLVQNIDGSLVRMGSREDDHRDKYGPRGPQR